MSKIILITGGAGFIGSNLCKNFLHHGNTVICVDNFFTGKKSNIESLMNNKNFTLIKHDIINPLDIQGNIDQIYHLACPASPPKYQLDSIYTLKINFLGSLNILELAREKKCSVLLASTSEIYGEPEISPQNESYRGNVNTIGIRSCYDEGKRIAETLFTDFYKNYNVDIRIVRIFNTYGPNMDINDGRVVTNFIKQMLNNEEITIYGTGNQTRSFCYIDDLLNGLIKLMDSGYHKPVNIGNTREISIKKLVEILYTLIDTKSDIIFKNLPKDDPTNRNPDITLARKILNWKPKIDLEEGLQYTISFLKSN